jgi:hypothetical protein
MESLSPLLIQLPSMPQPLLNPQHFPFRGPGQNVARLGKERIRSAPDSLAPGCRAGPPVRADGLTPRL